MRLTNDLRESITKQLGRDIIKAAVKAAYLRGRIVGKIEEVTEALK